MEQFTKPLSDSSTSKKSNAKIILILVSLIALIICGIVLINAKSDPDITAKSIDSEHQSLSK